MRPHKIKARCHPTPCNKSVGFRVSRVGDSFLAYTPKTVLCFAIYKCNKYPESFFRAPPPKTESDSFALP